MTYILDACTLINLLHIDEDEFLLKRLKKLRIKIAPKVFEEVLGNAYQKIKRLPNEEKNSYQKYLDSQIAQFRVFLSKESDFLLPEEDMEKILGYSKKNGEFHSTRLAFSISRMEETKVFFVTDDQPAKSFFQPIFQFHQVGYVEDNVDLLTLLYWLNDDFKKNHFSNFLSKLYSEYAQNLDELIGMFRNLFSNFPQTLLRDPHRNKLRMLIDKLEGHKFVGLSVLWKELAGWKKIPALTKVLKDYEFILELESGSTDLLEKISTLKNQLKSKMVFTAFSRN
jgi:hypothetical protein